MEPDFEPLFLSMALYDAREKRKISENFYLDLNSDLMKRMLQNHVPYADMSTLARSCIFNVSSHSAQDIFLVIRVSPTSYHNLKLNILPQKEHPNYKKKNTLQSSTGRKSSTRRYKRKRRSVFEGRSQSEGLVAGPGTSCLRPSRQIPPTPRVDCNLFAECGPRNNKS